MGIRALAGMEVPIIGSDSVNWVEVSVPSSTSVSHATATSSASPPFAPPTQDAASCSIVGDPPTHLIWRIHITMPRVLELLELCAGKEFPRIGLRIVFPDALSPFAFICESEIEQVSGKKLFLLYALTVSGVAYLLKLKTISAYVPCSVLPLNEIIEFNMQTYSDHGAITVVAATMGCLTVGRNDGSVGCFQLGMLDQSALGFAHELRDDSGIGRLWGLVSRGRAAGAVQELIISEVHGKKLVFVLHSNGILRVWDLFSHSRVFSHTLSAPMSTGAMFSRLWVGEMDHNRNIFPLAILCRGTLDVNWETISVYSLCFGLTDRIILALEPSMQDIPLETGQLIDVNLTSDKIWILRDNGLTFHSLFHADGRVEEARLYALHELFVADQLFQGSERSVDDLVWITHSVYSSAKDQIASVLSSIFLCRLLHPGVYHTIALRATFEDYDKHWTDSEFQSLNVDGLKKEILLLIEHEGFNESPTSIFYRWKNFTCRYFNNWCKNNAPYGFLVETSTGTVGLIRKNSISLFRSLEDIELLIHGSFDELSDFVSTGLDLFDDIECEIIFEVIRCVSNVSQQLGKAASAIFYESLVHMPILSSGDIVSRLLKLLETGYRSSISTLNATDLGADISWEKGIADHKNLRKFSFDMLVSLHALHKKATSWERVLNVVKSYLKFLVPQKTTQNIDSELVLNIGTSALVQATSQVARVMFESAFDILLFLHYLVDTSGQIHMLHDDISRIQLELVPMVQEIITEWLIIHYFGTTGTESPAIEDFSSQLSSLKIDSSIDKRSWKEKLGKCDFALAFILLLNSRSSSGGESLLSLRNLPCPHDFISSVRDFASWIIWGTTGEESSRLFSHATNIAVILLRHGQYDAVEFLLCIVDAHLCKEKISECIQAIDGEWCTLLHLLGCCFVAQAHYRLRGSLKERKLCEAVRCFFRASSGQGASEALRGLSYEAGLPPPGFGFVSPAAWKLHYYQWAMQIFEQYNFSEGACQFALAALEQVDEAVASENNSQETHLLNEPATTVKGRLWANVFKFTLDLNHFNDAYCAIISNPDEESKQICLRRFIIVLYERGAVKILCGGKIPFIGLTEQIERELAWKGERSDISATPNMYKLLYAFEMHRHNWRKAAGYIYQYSARMKMEAALKDYQQRSLALQGRLNGLSAAINALHLVHPAYAWIDSTSEENSFDNEHYPSKRSKKSDEKQFGNDAQPLRPQSHVDLDKLEKEFTLTSAEYMLYLANVKWTSAGVQMLPSDLVDLLVQMNLYDMAFTVLLKFWKDSQLKRELERVFVALSFKCCPSRADSSLVGNDFSKHVLLLTSSKDEGAAHGSLDACSTQQPNWNSQWETLEFYLEKYKGYHPTLPVIVAESLLRTDSHIELPLWLVDMFKTGLQRNTWGMTGREPSPASLFQLYVDYSRYTEATNLLLEYIERFASMKPADIIQRKRPSAVWFPYTTVERLWGRLDELITLGHMVDQCEYLKRLLHGALLRHLKLVKVDSEDAHSSAAC
ncbi:nuclear pore complex protein NUP160 [Malania oleifera]|uniref:nuclear pore complex protein NUP160 n=1 Tax=Malania oleifera TaxID=397392 RepID=UPI0025ADA35D|nr:nuclear pore complex protein NUP160 [Malania oleifera]